MRFYINNSPHTQTSTMATAKEILEFKKSFTDETGNFILKTTYYNDSLLHALIVITRLMDKAIQEPAKTLNMYCGQFSLFRDKTQKDATSAKNECDTSGLSEEQQEEWAAFNPYRTLQDRLAQFIKPTHDGGDGGILNVVLSKGFKPLTGEQVWPLLERGRRDGSVYLYELDNSLDLNHFATTSEAFRLESSDMQKTATGRFCDPGSASVLNQNFESLKEHSHQL